MNALLAIVISAAIVSLTVGQPYRYSSHDSGYRHQPGYGYRDGYKRCPVLDDPANGKVDVQGLKPGSKAIYSCNEGYELSGKKIRICQKNGVWSGEPPTCEPVDCGPPPPPDENGDVKVEGTTFRSIATYTCNPGYLVDTSNGGSPYIYCQANKMWSGIPPDCVPIDCGFLETPDNGKVDFIPDTKLDSIAQFSCIRGYKLVGNSYRQCQSDGEWSLTQPTCEKIKCPDLKPPAYGKVVTSGNCVDDYATYSCDYGFRLSGNKRRVCLEDGQWSGSDPKCNPIKKPYGPYHHGGYGDGGYRHGRYRGGYGHDKKDYQ